MNIVNAALKNEIKEAVETSRAIRAQINRLKWKPEGRVQVATILAQRRYENSLFGKGLPVAEVMKSISFKGNGKADLKPFRRPETGPERYSLWDDKREAGEHARYLLLAYGALRGRSYARVEPKCAENNKPSAYMIWNAMPDHVYPGPDSTWTEKNIEAWLKGTPLPIQEIVPMTAPPARLMEATA